MNNVDVESLSGQMAVAKALNSTFDNAEHLQVALVNFKVSSTGITLTDTKKKYAIPPPLTQTTPSRASDLHSPSEAN